jgi:hypothetical protein
VKALSLSPSTAKKKKKKGGTWGGGGGGGGGWGGCGRAMESGIYIEDNK